MCKIEETQKEKLKQILGEEILSQIEIQKRYLIHITKTKNHLLYPPCGTPQQTPDEPQFEPQKYTPRDHQTNPPTKETQPTTMVHQPTDNQPATTTNEPQTNPLWTPDMPPMNLQRLKEAPLNSPNEPSKAQRGIIELNLN